MAISISPKGFSFFPQGLAPQIDKLDLLRQVNVDFLPLDSKGRTIRTRPLIEDDKLNWREEYLRAAKVLLQNPLCYIATNLLSDVLSDVNYIVKEKQGNTWVKHSNNALSVWLEQPNPRMDKIEFVKAYITHWVNFGKVQAVMFQKNDISPNGSIVKENNTFEIIFPTRIYKNLENPNNETYEYAPLRSDRNFTLKPENVFTDVKYNPMAWDTGTALPNNPLRSIFDIHGLYIDVFHNLFSKGGIPSYILSRILDANKEPTSMGSITQESVDEEIERIYSKVGLKGDHRNGILGLKGNWELNRIGTPLSDVMQPEIMQWIETLVSGVYGIPASVFWAGLQFSNQRASRQMDVSDFYANTVSRTMKRVARNLGQFTVPKFLGSRWQERFTIYPDVSEMPLAQHVRAKDNREAERHWQLRITDKGYTYERLGLDTSRLTEEQKKEFYDGKVEKDNLNAGKGEQSIEENNGLE